MGGSGSRLMSSTVSTNNTDTGVGYRVSTNSSGAAVISANSYSDMIAGIEAQGYQVDAAYRRRNAGENEIIMYRNGQEYIATYTRYSDGDYEIAVRRR